MKENAAKYISSVIPNYVSLGMIKDIHEGMSIFYRIGMMLGKVYNKRQNKLKFKLVAKVVLKALKHQKMVCLRHEMECIRNTEKFKEKINAYLERPLKLKPVVEGRSLMIKNEEVKV